MTPIFVFGSNLAGRHGAGAALFAVEHYGAVYGQGIGLQGNSYGIPTKDLVIKTLTLDAIDRHIADFIDFAHQHPEYLFMLTPIGTGLAGYTRDQIFALVRKYDVPSNVVFTKEWFGL